MFDYDYYLWVFQIWALYFVVVLIVVFLEAPIISSFVKEMIGVLAVSSVAMAMWSFILLLSIIAEALDAIS